MTLSDPVFSFVETNPDRDADQELEGKKGDKPAEADEANEHDDDDEDRGDGDGELEGDDDQGGEQQLVVLPPQAPGQQELEVELQTRLRLESSISKSNTYKNHQSHGVDRHHRSQELSVWKRSAGVFLIFFSGRKHTFV